MPYSPRRAGSSRPLRPLHRASLCVIALSTLVSVACGQPVSDARRPDPELTPQERAGIAVLFGDAGSTLSEAARAEIYRGIGLVVSEDGSGLVDEVCGQPAGFAVRLEDLDGDGDDEAIVDFGNSCLSGMAGTSVALFIADADGVYRRNLGFPGMIAEIRRTGNEGYPELLIGGPGFCFAVWGWDGREYVFLRSEPQEPGGCDGVGP